MTNTQTEINEAIVLAKAVRKTALENAKISFAEQFNENYSALFAEKLKEEAAVQTRAGTDRAPHTVEDSVNENDVNESDIDVLIKELESDIEGGSAEAGAAGAAGAPAGETDSVPVGEPAAGAPPTSTAIPAPEGTTAPEGTPVVQAPVIVVAPAAEGGEGAPVAEPVGGEPELPPSGAPDGTGAGEEEDINLDELLESLKKEIEDDEKKEEKLEEETTLKSSGIGGKAGGSDNKKPANGTRSSSKIETGGLTDHGIPEGKVEAKDATEAKRPNEAKNATSTNLSTPAKGGTSGMAMKAARPNSKGDFESTAKLSEELAAKDSIISEQSTAINYLKQELNEINLLNSKLFYTNKLFKAYNINGDQKMKIVEMFDLSKTIREVKMTYANLTESMNFGIASTKAPVKKSNISPAKVKAITEGLDKTVVNGTNQPSKEILSESATVNKARFMELAGIKPTKK